jgi:hypothetical protein
VFTRVYDWGKASCVVEKKSSLYGYAMKAEVEANIAERKHVTPKLFYVFGLHGSWNLLEVIKKKHLYLKAGHLAYSISILAGQILKEEWDRDFFPDPMCFTGFDLKLKDLKDKHSETRLSILDVLMQLTSHPFNFRVPNRCFCNAL